MGDGFIYVARAQDPASPISYEVEVGHEALEARARVAAGDEAFAFDEYDEDLDEGGTFHLVEPWSTAGHALLHAAMALGALGLVPENDRVHLLRGWHALRGPRS